jgi:hypothetical protein
MGLDIHREQITCDALDTESAGSGARIRPAIAERCTTS